MKKEKSDIPLGVGADITLFSVELVFEPSVGAGGDAVDAFEGSYEAACVAVFELLGDLGEGEAVVVERFEDLLDFDLFAMMLVGDA